MEITLPVFVRVIKGRGSRPTVYRAQLLFHRALHGDDEVLQRAMNKLTRLVRKNLDSKGARQDHRALADITFNPDVETTKVKLALDLRDRMVSVGFFIVTLRALGRTIAFNPSLPSVWFEVTSGQTLKSRALEVYTKYFRDEIKTHGPDADRPEDFAIDSESWVTTIDVNVETRQVSSEDDGRKLMALWSSSEMSGSEELHRVGRCLDWLYPDDLERAVGREVEILELENLLAMKDRRPILLIGPSMVGKTAVIHESVRRRIEKRINKSRAKKNVWLLSPGRLISGMSYVGQWENRVQAILKESARQDHVLYFDDPVGLFRAGQSSNSSLSVADLLKESLRKREVRVLAETTPEAYDRLIGLDRNFADQFHVLRIEPTDDRTTMKICISVARDAEQKQNCQFLHQAIPAAIQLQRQYVRQASFPGKAARFLKQCSVRNSSASINREAVLNEFCETAGVSLSLIDDRTSISRAQIDSFFKQRMIGQQEALDACADTITVAKARLNNTSKPLATLLFTGPTGVGKTECAKTMSEFLFRSSEKLIRIDLNEFKSAYSAARLVGTFDNPEGLLTGAVRRQPYCVVLLDEIEKAHPDVFDILLQVTGEGRLTDALGRTTDFSNAVIVMTSNLGASHSLQGAGFNPVQDEHRYVVAARKFFKPEFFNRIDRVIPFHPLNREQIAHIAEKMMDQVVAREGLVRRRCILQVDSDAITRVVGKGYHPELGARAMKRAIEDEFTGPVSTRLSAVRSDVPTIVRLSCEPDSTAGGFAIDVEPLQNVEGVARFNNTPDPAAFADAAAQFVARIREEQFPERPAGELSTSGMTPELLRYFALDEQANTIEESLAKFRESIIDKKLESGPPALPVSGERKRKMRNRENRKERRILMEINSVSDIRKYIDESMTTAEQGEAIDPAISMIAGSCGQLQAMTASKTDEACFFFVFCGSLVNRQTENVYTALHRSYLELFRGLDYDVHGIMPEPAGRDLMVSFHVRGSCLSAVLDLERGTQLICDEAGKLSIVQTGFAVRGEPYFDKLVSLHDQVRKHRPSDIKVEVDFSIVGLLREHSSFEVTRLHDFNSRTTDLRTGMVLSGKEQMAHISAPLKRSFELPRELQTLI